jgi:hypothetical protein
MAYNACLNNYAKEEEIQYLIFNDQFSTDETASMNIVY